MTSEQEKTPLTSEQAGEQSVLVRHDPDRRDHSGFRVISGNPTGNVGNPTPSRWPVVSNLALVPALTSEQLQPLTSEQPKYQCNQPYELLTSEQLEEAAEWLKSLLPKPSNGWWDVATNGKGFVFKQRWRVSRKQETQTYPRISREQFLTLQGMSDEHAKETIADSIAGHLDEVVAGRDRDRRDKARRAASRLNITC